MRKLSAVALVLMVVGNGGLLFGGIAPAALGFKPILSETAAGLCLLAAAAAVVLKWASDKARVPVGR